MIVLHTVCAAHDIVDLHNAYIVKAQCLTLVTTLYCQAFKFSSLIFSVRQSSFGHQNDC